MPVAATTDPARPDRSSGSGPPPTTSSGTADRIPVDDHGWVEHWARHRGSIVRYVAHLLAGDLHAAEDVAQETAVRLWQHPHVLDDDRPLERWLRTVARNIVVDRARSRDARPTEVALSADVDGETADDLELVHATAAVRTIVSGLAPKYRDVVVEVYARDRPVAAVAIDLGIPAGTVKSRCHAALRLLRDRPLSTTTSPSPSPRRSASS
jgi:RNA polymerase sigma-70 factor, ECF subfamily